MIIFNKITKTEAYVELTTENGEKHIIPTSDVIFVNDESGFVSIKNTGSRKTIGLISEEAYNKNPDEPEHYKVWGYLTDGSVYVIEENGYSVLTSEETKSYRYTMATANIGTGVTELGNDAFMHNENLTSITIPNSVTSIGNSVLYSCSNLTSVTIPNSVTSIGDSLLYFAENLETIKLPDGLTHLQNYTCRYALKLSAITIPNSVISIGDYVFEQCNNITSLIIPPNVTSIGRGAFNTTNRLTKVVMMPNTPPTLGESAFLSSNGGMDKYFYVPDASVDAYKAAPNWSDYADRIKPMSEYQE